MMRPPVIDNPSSNFNSRQGTRIDVIVLHHTGSNNGRADLAWLRNSESSVSAHYLVDRDGRIHQLVADANRAAINTSLDQLPSAPNPKDPEPT